MGTTPTISVVIPTYNRLDRWPAVLDSLASQTFDFDGFEVVVVSDGSTDGTDEFLTSVSPPFDLVFETQANGGPAAARNRGTKLARAPLILFIDDDIVAAPTLIERHVRRHKDAQGDIAVIGPMLSPVDAALSPPIRWEQAMLYKQYDAMARGAYRPTYRQFFTGNASIRRASVLEAGGFDLRFRRNEDVELAYRMHLAGVRFLFDPDAVGYHFAERPYRSWLRNAHDYGVNDVKFARDHQESGLFEITQREYSQRHRLVKWATRACVAQPWFERTTERMLRAVATAADRAGASGLAQHAMSGSYNVAYYCGMADELGGSGEFCSKIARSRG